MKLKFHITSEKVGQLNWAAQIALAAFQRGETADMEDAREILVPFVVNENNEPLSETEARRAIGRVPGNEIAEAIAKFSAALVDFTVPKQNGTSSRPSLEGTVPVPDGSPTLS